MDRIAFRPMRDRRPFSLAIASIGVAFVLENVVRFIWGNDFRSYDVPVTRADQRGTGCGSVASSSRSSAWRWS